ncbi:hypothetical protein [Microbacterium oleivorans]|uniref:hypothetical protein n=1 Tax=Microbacterium oleivorans TaxID=273677 RepID=UPI0007674AAD|nr:hypothetical protein [Microbacterium oleivorans]
MTAYAVGQRAVRTDFSVLDNNENAVAKSLGVITELIPAEAIAAFLALRSAIAALGPENDAVRVQLDVWVAMGVAALVTIAFAFIGAASDLRNATDTQRPKKIAKVLAHGIGLSLLFVVYVAALPANPLQALYGIDPAWGGLVAVVITIVWGVIKAAIEAARPPAGA